MQLNRNSSPQIQKITKIALPTIYKSNLSNGIPVFTIDVGTQEVVKIQLLFKAGIWFQSQPLQAFFTGQMLEEGSRSFTASEIAEKLDDYGAYVNKKVSRDNTCIDILTLNKHLESVLTIVAEMVKYPLFGQQELDRFREQERHEFIVHNQKVNHIAQKHFSSLLFGEKHPYGGSANIVDYDKITPLLLKQFHQMHYGSNNCQIFISGKINDTTLPIINNYFAKENWGVKDKVHIQKHTAFSSLELKHFISKENVVQSAIRMGKRSIGRNHPDYFSLSVVTTLFGGYFGSRLMSNIREDKGYTYGIHAGIYPLLHDSSFIISSEVGADVSQKAIHEIRYELKRLRTERVKNDELNQVKNYMAGTFLRNLNGPFALGEVIKSIYELDLPEDFYQQYLTQIHKVTPKDIKTLASLYLHEDEMIELIVGKQ